ncbi:hypothetical protein GCM10011452_01690 [Gemmobacter lanyuensis]|uniref:Uncharacterized protein n=1 Tax=Gemmobacter lanyuensis TaxID=1054497 RepID=A0A918IKN2_9RHOB|nr:hypothetical protein GCM10011452_01690 [Gemmobacter lanyuensis]
MVARRDVDHSGHKDSLEEIAMSAMTRVRQTASLKLTFEFPAGWWLVPAILGGTSVWVVLGYMVFG